ncbi:unnamed protein product, partial [Phaeothamnion confervicola]
RLRARQPRQICRGRDKLHEASIGRLRRIQVPSDHTKQRHAGGRRSESVAIVTVFCLRAVFRLGRLRLFASASGSGLETIASSLMKPTLCCLLFVHVLPCRNRFCFTVTAAALTA